MNFQVRYLYIRNVYDPAFKNHYNSLDNDQIKLIYEVEPFGKKPWTNLIYGYEDTVQVNINLPTQIIWEPKSK